MHSTLPLSARGLKLRLDTFSLDVLKEIPSNEASPEALSNDPSKPSANYLKVSFFKMLLQLQGCSSLRLRTISLYVIRDLAHRRPTRIGAMLRTCKKNLSHLSAGREF